MKCVVHERYDACDENRLAAEASLRERLQPLPGSFSPGGSLSRADKDFLTEFASAEGIGGTITCDEQADRNSGGTLLFLSNPRHNDRFTLRVQK